MFMVSRSDARRVLLLCVLALAALAAFPFSSARADYSAEVIGDAPLAYWPLNDASTASLTDASGHNWALLGTSTGLTPQVTGPFPGAKAIGFNGGYLWRNYLNYTNNFAIETWARSNRVAERQAIVSNGWVGTDSCWHGVLASTSNASNAGAYDANTCNDGGWSGLSSTFASNSDWHHLVVQRSNGVTTFYVDGDARSATDTHAIRITGGNFRVGGWYDPAKPNGIGLASDSFGTFSGAISNVAFYDHTLTPARIAKHYNITVGAPTSSTTPAISPNTAIGTGTAVTAARGSWVGADLTYTYQWLRCDADGTSCGDIAGATSATYTLTDDDAGRAIRVRVTATSTEGTTAATSDATEPVAYQSPHGQTLYDAQVVGDAPLAYWPLNDASTTSFNDASGHNWALLGTSTGLTGQLTGPFPGAKAVGFNGGYLWRNYLSYTNNFAIEAWARSNRANEREAIFGNGWVGSDGCSRGVVVSANVANAGAYDGNACGDGGWTGLSPTFASNTEWHHFFLQRSNGATTLYVDGTARTPPDTHAISITAGNFRVGGWYDPSKPNGIAQYPDTFATFRGAISNVTFYDHTLTPARIAAHYNAATGAPTATTRPAVSPSGALHDGDTVTAATGTWAGTGTLSYGYQWQACDTTCSPIAGATSSAYTLSPAQIGKTIKVVVTATDAVGTGSATSAATSAVVAALPANTAAPTVSGDARDGATLTADHGTWTGSPTIAYTYRWQRDTDSGFADIDGATGASYTATGDDTGHTLRVRVTATNDSGSATATSAATDVVVAVAPAGTDAPTISGTALDGETLSATDGAWTGTTPIAHARQWQRCDADGTGCSDIAGATSETYTLTSADVGHTLRVVVTATNAEGSATATSAASAVVQALPGVPAPTPLADDEVAPIADTTKFLYEGDDAVQHGVDPGTIAVERGAVVRGNVVDRLGHPLAGVTVSVVDHPEYGTTATAPNGDFYMAVNGGARLTVRMERDGYLSIDRDVDVPSADYASIDDVTMVALDDQVTDVQLGSPLAPMQVAQGDPETDADGTRQATLLFQPGTDATMVMPDGSTQPVIGDAHVRATEFTVGATGESAMPAPLPPQSGYTYAAEFSLDEAQTAGATEVRFSKPVISYTNNFVGFRVGSPVPAGYYDRDRAQWVASDNGRVIKVIGESDGLADLDVTGSGEASSQAELEALAITDAERQRLASLYDPGDSLWRVALDHFTPWDFNWPYGPPANAVGPDGKPYEPGPQPYCAVCNGSIIESENQVLGETADAVGVPQTLNYRSDRVPGYRDADQRVIHLTGATVPAGVTHVELAIDVAGVHTEKKFDPSPNLEYTFAWDRRDAFGREVNSGVPMTTEVRYDYAGARYDDPAAFQRSFAQPGGAATTRNARGEVGVARQSTTTIGAVNPTTDDLGGWTLSDHHFYDALSGTLLMGDGTRVTAEAVGEEAQVLAGDTLPSGGVSNSFAAKRPAAAAARLAEISPEAFQRPLGVVAEADGSVVVAEGKMSEVLRIKPDGDVVRIGGTGAEGFSGDGGPATAADMSPVDVDETADGSVLVADGFNDRIRRIAPDGTISTLAGTGAPGATTHDGDGGPATSAHIGRPSAVAAAPDGSFYIADRYNSLIRRVTPDGVIRTVVGGGDGFAGDGGDALTARISGPSDLAIGPDGSLYIADTNNQRIRRVTPNGRIDTVAGSGATGYGSGGFSGDGGAATSATLSNPSSVAVGSGGTLYIGDSWNARVRRVDESGTIATVGGHPMDYMTPERFAKGSPDQVPFGELDGIALTASGDVLVTDGYLGALYRIGKGMPGFTGEQQLVPAPDGTEVYVFDRAGRQLETRDGLTGDVTRTFGYDDAGRLISDTDGYGNATRIERDAVGRPTAIVGPYGQRTTITLDGGGHLQELSSPMGSKETFGYAAGGLLTSWADGSGTGSTFEYDTAGRLTRDENAAGGATTLSRSGLDDGREVHLSGLGAGSATSVGVQDLDSGTVKRTETDSAGLTSTRLERPDGSVQLTDPDGTVAVQQSGADPQFGAQVKVPASEVVTTPGGRTIETRTSREVEANGLEVDALHSTTTVNGREYRTDYDGSTRTRTDTSPTGAVTTVKLDDHGRPYWQKAPGLSPVIYHYDTHGRVTSTEQGGRSDHVEYGADGWVSAMTDPIGRRWEYEYDADGNMVRRTSPSGAVTRFRTDSTGSLVGVTPPGQPEHGLSEDGLGDPVSHAPPGTASAITDHYDKNGTLTSTDRPGSGTISYDYDAAGRTSAVREPDRTTDLHYDADSGALASLMSSDGEGISYNYDGPLLTGEHTSGAVPGTFTYGFDDQLRITSSTIGGDAAVDYAYDDDDALTQAGREALGWDAGTRLLTSAEAGGVRTSMAYDGADRGYLTSAVTSSGGDTVLRDVYDRDDDGRVTALHETLDGATHDYTYTYDDTGRLLGVQRDGAAWSAYTYDVNGNRLTADDPAGGGARTATFDSADRMLSEGGRDLAYDPIGQLKTVTDAGGDATTYDYDAVGNLVSVDRDGGAHVTYKIGVLDHPVERKVDGTVTNRWLWSAEANGPSAELDAGGDVTTRYIYGQRTWVPDLMRRGGHTYRLVQDQWGSVRAVVDVDSGDVVQRLDYDPFGRVLRDTNPGFQPFGYGGGLYDHVTGLVRFGVRHYDAELGRWTTPDPTGFSGDDTNLYAYVLGDPVNGIDPGGEISTQNVSDCAAGFADTVTMGLTGWFRRNVTHSDDNVDRSSGCYKAGDVAGQFYPTGKVVRGLKLAKKCKKALRFAEDAEDDAYDGYRHRKQGRESRPDRLRRSDAVRNESDLLDWVADKEGVNRHEFGKAVEAFKKGKGIPNDGKVSRQQAEYVARTMRSSWKDGPGRGRGNGINGGPPWAR
jgi:RHS repeat-associated protein